MQRTLIVSLGLFSLAACGDDDAGVPPSLQDDLQAILDDAVANQVTPGAVLHVSAGDDSWSTAAGVADLAQTTPMTPGARFRAGSIMKSFVATAVLQAVEAGTLALDDVLTDHLPPAVTDRIEGAAQIRIDMLLAHRSGIPEWLTDAALQTIVADPTHVWSLDDMLAQVETQPAPFPPGEAYAYSNTNYVLLGEILTATTGRDWRAIVRDDVVAAAGLDDTLLPEPGDTACPGCAHGYVPFEGQLLDFTGVDPSMAGASGGHALVTTAADLTHFLQQLRAGALFEDPATVDAMFTLQPAPDAENHSVAYGYGIAGLSENGTDAIGHLGGTAGYQSFMLYIPSTDRYLSGSINVLGDLGAVLTPILDRAAAP